MKEEKIKIVIMTADSLRHRYVTNFLAMQFDIVGVVSEALVPLDLSDEIIRKHFQERDQKESVYFEDNDKFNAEKVLSVSRGESNSEKVFNWIKDLNPDFIILYGTSIIKDPLLSYFENRIINMHLGLSPYYRGSGTNFWPLVDRKPECVGTTIHLAITKVDAGSILAQVRPGSEISDRCHDIGCKAITAGVELIPEVIKKYYENKIKPQPQSGQGKLCRVSDFNNEAVLKMWDNFNTGMMKEYLTNKEIRDKQYPICAF